MATLSGSTIASTYDRLLALPSGGLNGTTLVAITDGNSSTACCLQLATTKAMIEGSGSKLFFSDEGGEHISGNGSVLSIAGGSEVDLTATAIDINGTVDISGTLALNDDVTIVQGKKIIFDSADTYIYANTDNPEDLVIGADADIILEPDGKVGIGESSPGAKLDIESTGAIYSGTPTLLVRDTSNRGTIILESEADKVTDIIFKNNNRLSWSVSTRNAAGNYNLHFYSSANGSSFSKEGDWDTDTGVLALTETHTSDIGLKENIVDLSDGLTKALALKPRTFDWKRTARGSNNGFIAQEVEDVLPDDIHGKDWTEENPEDWKSVSVVGIVAVCVKAIQELSAKVTALENA